MPHAPSLPRTVARAFAGALVLAGLALSAAPAAAGDRVWAAVVLASQAERAKPPPVELGRAAAKIGKFFGYNHVEIIGTASKELEAEGAVHWLVPSQHFWMSVQEKHNYEDGYLVNVTLYHDQRQLVETEGKVAPNSPLIMRGPMHARGQLIFVIQIVR